MIDNREEMLEVKSVTESGKPVKERIPNYEVAYNLYRDLQASDEVDVKRRVAIKGMIDGNPPYSAQRLRELGMENEVNINFGEAAAILNSKADAFFELFYEVPLLADFKFNKTDLPVQEAMRVPAIEHRVASEFTRLIRKRWSGFMFNMMKVRQEADRYGIGVMIFDDEWDWRPKAVQRGAFLVDPKDKLDLDSINVFAVLDSKSLQEIYSVALNPTSLKARPSWNESIIKKLLIKKFNELVGGESTETYAYETSMWEAFQQRVKNNDPMMYKILDSHIDVVNLFVKEDDDSISHYILYDGTLPGIDDFMYRKVSKYKNIRNVLWVLPAEFGDGYIKSCRGLASKIFNHCDLNNRFLSQVFSTGMLSGSLLLQHGSSVTGGPTVQPILRMGSVTVIPKDVSIVQQSFAPRLAELMSLRDLSYLVMKTNTGVWRPNTEMTTIPGQEKTAYQVSVELNKEARMEKTVVNLDYIYLTNLYEEMFRRLTNKKYVSSTANLRGKDLAIEFRDRCVKYGGVPENYLYGEDAFGFWDIEANRAIGMGSYAVRLETATRLLDLVLRVPGVFDEEGKTNAIREYLSALIGYQNVDKFKPLINRDMTPTNETSIAVLETNSLLKGEKAVAGKDQNATIHLRVHIPVFTELVNQAVQALNVNPDAIPDPERILNAILAFNEHVLATVEYLRGDPSYNSVVAQLRDLLSVAKDCVGKLQRVVEQRIQTITQQQINAQQGMLAGSDVVNSFLANNLLGIPIEVINSFDPQTKAQLLVQLAKQVGLNEIRREKTSEQLNIKREAMQRNLELKREEMINKRENV